MVAEFQEQKQRRTRRPVKYDCLRTAVKKPDAKKCLEAKPVVSPRVGSCSYEGNLTRGGTLLFFFKFILQTRVRINVPISLGVIP